VNHLDFFGIKDNPFKLTPDREFYYPSAAHNSVSEVLKYGLEQGEGFLVVTGEVGTGKTMLLKKMSTYLHRSFQTAYIISPQLTSHELIIAILQDVGEMRYDLHQASIPVLFDRLYGYLVRLNKLGKRLVLIIDEAQDLPEKSIEQLRLISNFETDKEKLIQILLVGQPELQDKINRPSLRQLKQRITINETIRQLTLSEMRDYIIFRLNRVGRADMAPIQPHYKLIYRLTAGTPRLVNKLLSRCLLMAYASKQQQIDKRCVKNAAKSLDMKPVLGWFSSLTA
jgi:type II secretory pathway predicted ATPase ExeA